MHATARLAEGAGRRPNCATGTFLAVRSPISPFTAAAVSEPVWSEWAGPRATPVAAARAHAAPLWTDLGLVFGLVLRKSSGSRNRLPPLGWEGL